MKGKVGDFCLNLLFPKRCPWCERVLGFQNSCICETDLQVSRLPKSPLPHRECQELEEMWACFAYEPPVSEACHRLKYEGEREVAEPLGQEMAQCAFFASFEERMDIMIPVPLSKRAKKERGFNQSELLAQEISKQTGLLLKTDCLLKIKETERQQLLGHEERQKNVRDAFVVAENSAVQGKHILLIDDVLTTGSTLRECAKTLHMAGAKSCSSFTLLAVLVHEEKDLGSLSRK